MGATVGLGAGASCTGAGTGVVKGIGTVSGGGVGIGSGGGAMTGNFFGSGGFSGGSSIALGGVMTVVGAVGLGSALCIGAATGLGVMARCGCGSGGFSRGKVMGARYVTMRRTERCIGIDCSTSHSSATCSKPVAINAGRDRRGYCRPRDLRSTIEGQDFKQWEHRPEPPSRARDQGHLARVGYSYQQRGYRQRIHQQVHFTALRILAKHRGPEAAPIGCAQALWRCAHSGTFQRG